MNHLEAQGRRLRCGWLLAPLLLMLALTANAANKRQRSAKSATQHKTLAPARKKAPLLLAQNSRQGTPQYLAQSNPQAVGPGTRLGAVQLQQVIITGSRIARPPNDRVEPTIVISPQTFVKRGYTNVGQALTELPEFGVQPSSQHNQQSAFGVGQSFVDLYSLGSQRMLVPSPGRSWRCRRASGSSRPGTRTGANHSPSSPMRSFPLSLR